MSWAVILLAAFVAVLGASALLTRRLVRQAERDYPPTGSWVGLDAGRLHYLESGEGPPVVLIHGLRGSSYDFEVSISAALARRFHVVAFDRPGHGYSDPLPDDVHSLAAEAAQLHAAVRKLGLGRPLLVAYSLGAAVAMAYAATYPDDVAGVVTISGHVLPYRVHVGPLAFFATRPWIAGVSSNTLLVPVGRLVGRAILRKACAPRPVPPWYQRVALSMALRPRTFRFAPAELVGSARELRQLAERYAQVSVPVTVLTGHGDVISRSSEARHFHRRLPNANLIVVPDGGHALHATHPDLVVAAVEGAGARTLSSGTGGSVYGQVAGAAS